MKKILSLLLSAVLLVSLLAGCGGAPAANDNPAPSNNSTAPANNSSAPANNSSAPAEPAAGGSIKVAAIETAYGADMWKEVCAAFTEATGIEVELTTNKNLEDVIDPQMQAGDYPDVVHLATGREKGLTEQFIKEKLLVELTDVLSMTVPGESAKVSDKIAGGFTDTSVTNPYGDGKTYLAPMFYSPCGLFYNAGLLEEKGWSVPTTWDEMWELGDKAAAEGIALFTYPTTGYFDAFFYALMRSTGDVDFYNSALAYGEGVWDSAAGKACLDVVAKLATYTNSKTPAQANGSDFTKNQQLVIDGEAIFMPNGTWVIGEMEATTPEGFKWGMCPIPAATSSGAPSSYCWLEQAWIPEGGENVEGAKQFVAFLYSDTACEIFYKAGAVQPVVGQTDNMEGDNKLFYSIYDNGAVAAMGSFAPYDASSGLPTNMVAYFDPVNGLVAGTVTPEKWMSDFKSYTDSFRANLIA